MFLTLICAKSRLGQPLSANDQLGYYQHQLILEDALFFFIFFYLTTHSRSNGLDLCVCPWLK